jgi:hypothetical protein
VSYWTYEDMTLGRCGARDIGCPRGNALVTVDAPTVEVTRLDTSPAGIVRAAVETLLRAAQQTRDLPSAVKAASALLRYYAPPPQPLGVLPVGEQEWPAWLTQRRLAYQEGELPPADLPQLSQEPSNSPEPVPPTCPPAQSPPASFRPLHLVQPEPSRFYDRPGLPAEGSMRDPNRH